MKAVDTNNDGCIDYPGAFKGNKSVGRIAEETIRIPKVRGTNRE